MCPGRDFITPYGVSKYRYRYVLRGSYKNGDIICVGYHCGSFGSPPNPMAGEFFLEDVELRVQAKGERLHTQWAPLAYRTTYGDRA